MSRTDDELAALRAVAEQSIATSDEQHTPYIAVASATFLRLLDALATQRAALEDVDYLLEQSWLTTTEHRIQEAEEIIERVIGPRSTRPKPWQRALASTRTQPEEG